MEMKIIDVVSYPLPLLYNISYINWKFDTLLAMKTISYCVSCRRERLDIELLEYDVQS